MVIACDVDDVCCDLVTEWIRKYDLDYNDTLSKEDVSIWNISSFVKPECGMKIYDYLDSGSIYDGVIPIKGALEGVLSLLSKGHRVIFVTAGSNGHAGRKLRWLQQYGFLEAGKKQEKDYVECYDKSLIRADVLIDDGIHNLLAFQGKKIRFLQPWNITFSVPGEWIACDWGEIPDIIEEIENEKQG